MGENNCKKFIYVGEIPKSLFVKCFYTLKKSDPNIYKKSDVPSLGSCMDIDSMKYVHKKMLDDVQTFTLQNQVHNYHTRNAGNIVIPSVTSTMYGTNDVYYQAIKVTTLYLKK